MVQHYLSDFLENRVQYAEAASRWRQLWSTLVPSRGSICGWREPWLNDGGVHLRDGNPIFSAYSPAQRKGVRIIQHAPTSNELEFEYWLDTTGGGDTDPESIQELVISCALCSEALTRAKALIREWASDKAVHSEDEWGALPTAVVVYRGDIANPCLALAK